MDGNLDREVEAIQKNYVFCPRYEEMNDPMEGSHRESALLRASSRYAARKQEVETALKTLGIASFSETHLHEPMWAYYAGDFKGICVEYSVARLLKELGDDCELVRMTYGEEPPILLRNAQSATDRAKLILSCKALRWSGEREWRLIRPYRGAATYVSHRAVTAVFLGSRIDEGDEHKVRSAMKPLNIVVRRMKVDSYNLNFDSDPSRRQRKPSPGATGAGRK